MMSTGAKVVLGLLGVGAVAGVVYEVTKKPAATTAGAAAPAAAAAAAGGAAAAPAAAAPPGAVAGYGPGDTTVLLDPSATSYPNQSLSTGGMITVTTPAGGTIQSASVPTQTPGGLLTQPEVTIGPPGSLQASGTGTAGTGSLIVNWTDASGTSYAATIPFTLA